METWAVAGERKTGARVEGRVDGRVVEACQRGDREAFRLLFDAYKDRVFSISLHFLHGDQASAEDVTQEVFLRVFTRIGQFRREADFSTWLYRLVVNACIDEQRRRRPVVSLDEAGAMYDGMTKDQTGEPYEKAEIAEAVKAAVADLAPELRMTVLLKYFDQLSYDEMAKALGCSKGTIGSRLNRSHKFLARKLAHLRDALGAGD